MVFKCCFTRPKSHMFVRANTTRTHARKNPVKNSRVSLTKQQDSRSLSPNILHLSLPSQYWVSLSFVLPHDAATVRDLRGVSCSLTLAASLALFDPTIICSSDRILSFDCHYKTSHFQQFLIEKNGTKTTTLQSTVLPLMWF